MGAAPGYTASTCLRAGSSSPNPLPGHLFSCRLFPLREPGVNWHAKPLTLREVEVSQALAVAGGGDGEAWASHASSETGSHLTAGIECPLRGPLKGRGPVR